MVHRVPTSQRKPTTPAQRNTPKAVSASPHTIPRTTYPIAISANIAE